MSDQRPPTLPRDLRVTISDLKAIAYDAMRTAVALRDVHVLAYERQVTNDEVTTTSTRTAWYLDTVGDERAKEALRKLMSQHDRDGAKAIRRTLAAYKAEVQALFTGPGADLSLRGTLLGDEKGDGAQRELTAVLKAQGRRAERGEYTPSRSEPQPKRVPGAGG